MPLGPVTASTAILFHAKEALRLSYETVRGTLTSDGWAFLSGILLMGLFAWMSRGFRDVVFAGIPPKEIDIRKEAIARVAKLAGNLARDSRELDVSLSELAAVTRNRQKEISRIEELVRQLEERETATKERIEKLEQIPASVAKYLAGQVRAFERRGVRRDLVFLGAGILIQLLASTFFG